MGHPLSLTDLMSSLSTTKFAPEADVLDALIREAALPEAQRAQISGRATELVRRIRKESAPTLMEHFLAEYGLSTREGVALMCLAEAMLRVPDRETIDDLIEDKVAPSDWGEHLGHSSSAMVNASTWALMLTGRVLDDEKPGQKSSVAGTLRGLVKRMGEPVIRTAVSRAMKEMGQQFVLGQTIDAAMTRAKGQEAKGFTYSYDMLGEAAMTQADADAYAKAYSDAMTAIAKGCTKGSVADNPGISVKLSALHPRYDVAQEARVMAELVPVLRDLARQARAAGMGFNIDAEEQARLTLSLRVIRAVLEDEKLAGWDGFGVVVQAYGKRAGLALDWLYQTAEELDRKLMVRLVKGAYWDTEMKLAQVEGHPGFPLFTTKDATDVSYIANAKKLLGYSDRIYPQFAGHNAHTVAAILELAREAGNPAFEFQRLHGMGERLHDIVLKDEGTRCRIYAPVGKHQDLLAYLVRRLLENGANSSFVNQIVDESVTPEEIAIDPFVSVLDAQAPAGLVQPSEIFGARDNSKGFDLKDETTLARIEAARGAAFDLNAAPMIAGEATGTSTPVVNPSTGETVGEVVQADAETVSRALDAAALWDAPVSERAAVLRRAADLYEANFGKIFAVLAYEAGKNLPDAVGELREAVDFLRYYADEAERRPNSKPLGRVTAISPWNFPLAIFTGQISAALAMGNAVLAKPAEQTPLIAALAVDFLHEAGVPVTALQLLPGDGPTVGAGLTSDARIDGVVFTGSTETAQIIRRAMAANLAPGAPLIAETGGLNAMIVDSTALPEQAVRDIVASAFQSAGQRCSALRCLYVQEDIAPALIEMIKGAMDELSVGNPWLLSTDVGPVIDREARDQITAYVDAAGNRVLHRLKAPTEGTFVAPALVQVEGIESLEREVFGPVLHIATYKARDLGKVIETINATGYGLTFGLHTRIDDRVQQVCDALHVGNLYVNRNQIGAIVGSQPFGGEGLSGTGPKAGGPLYLNRFSAAPSEVSNETWDKATDAAALQRAITATPLSEEPLSKEQLPGPTGEANTLSTHSRPPFLCLGPGRTTAEAQAKAITDLGGLAVVAEGLAPSHALKTIDGFGGVIWWGDAEKARAYGQALSQRLGAILPLVTTTPDAAHVLHERHLCVDTTAAGGNAALLSGEA